MVGTDDKEWAVLVAAADEEEGRWIERWARSHIPEARFEHVRSGSECLDFLRNDANEEGDRRPPLVLLNLGLADMPGLRVLESIRSDENLKTVQVVVLTRHNHEYLIQDAYELEANAFAVQPMDPNTYGRILRQFRASEATP